MFKKKMYHLSYFDITCNYLKLYKILPYEQAGGRNEHPYVMRCEGSAPLQAGTSSQPSYHPFY